MRGQGAQRGDELGLAPPRARAPGRRGGTGSSRRDGAIALCPSKPGWTASAQPGSASVDGVPSSPRRAQLARGVPATREVVFRTACGPRLLGGALPGCCPARPSRRSRRRPVRRRHRLAATPAGDRDGLPSVSLGARVSMACFIIVPAAFVAASVALSFIAPASELRELVGERAPPLHRIDDAGAATAALPPWAGRASFRARRRAAGRRRPAPRLRRAIFSESRRSPSARSSSSASTASCAGPRAPGSSSPASWRSARARTAPCAARRCASRSSAGSSVGATHWPMPGRAAPAFLTRLCRKSKPGTSFAKLGMLGHGSSSVASVDDPTPWAVASSAVRAGAAHRRTRTRSTWKPRASAAPAGRRARSCAGCRRRRTATCPRRAT